MFYTARDGKQYGPYSEEDLRAMVARGEVGSGELIWREGMQGWAPLHTVLRSVPPPPPPAGAGAQPGPSAAPPPPAAAQPVYATTAAPAPKARVAYVLLGVFLGTLGIHNFYAGYNGRAIAQLLITILVGWMVFPVAGVFLWNVVEVITVTKDASGVAFS